MSQELMEFEIGHSVTHKRVFAQADIDRFASLSGDDNPIHVDPEFASQTIFGRTVCHGMLLYSAIGQVIGNQLPGPGAVQLRQELKFPAPTFAGDEIGIQVTVEAKDPKAGTITLDTTITRPDGQVTCQGKALVGMDPSLLGTVGDTILEPEASDTAGLKGLKVGQQASDVGIFTVFELAEYVDLVGDTNPICRDADFAEAAGLTGPIVPGPLIGGMFSKLLGTKLPGPGTAWLKQTLTFLAPVYPGEVLTANVRIIKLRPEKNLVNLLTTCTRTGEDVVCSGEALVSVKGLS